MNDVPRQKLREILTQYGRSICENPQHCKGLLLDLCGEQKREINILIAVLEEHAVADLMHSSASVPTEMLLARLTERLCDNRSMEKEAARWGVESWALALGMNISKTSRTPRAKTSPEKPPDKVEEEKPASKTSRTPRAKTAVPAKTPQEKSPDKVDEDKLRSFAAGLRSFDAELRQHNQEELRRVREKQSQSTTEKVLPVSPPQAPRPSSSQPGSVGKATPMVSPVTLRLEQGKGTPQLASTTPAAVQVAEPTSQLSYEKQKKRANLVAAGMVLLNIVMSIVIFRWLASDHASGVGLDISLLIGLPILTTCLIALLLRRLSKEDLKNLGLISGLVISVAEFLVVSVVFGDFSNNSGLGGLGGLMVGGIFIVLIIWGLSCIPVAIISGIKK